MNATNTRKAIPPDLLSQPIQGFHLRGDTLTEELGDRLTMLYFLRHLG